MMTRPLLTLVKPLAYAPPRQQARGRSGSETMHDQPDPRQKPIPADWQKPIEEWRIALVAAQMADESIRTRMDHLRRASRALDGSPWDVTGPQLLDWCGRQDWARETRRSFYASLRRFYLWAQQAELVEKSPAEALPTVKPGPPMPRPIPETHLAIALAECCDRTRIILLLAAETGMRRGEISQVNDRDLIEDLTGWSLLVHGKGGKLRIVPISDDLAREIRQRCKENGGWLLPGRINGHLSAKHVGNLASRMLPKDWALHSLRHRCATVVHAATGDLLVVQRILGHASVATTQRYVLVPDDAVRAALVHASTGRSRPPLLRAA